MNIIKIHSQKHGLCVLKAYTEDLTLFHFVMLFREAKKDFPTLTEQDVNLKQYASGRNIFGIEFAAKEFDVPTTYRL